MDVITYLENYALKTLRLQMGIYTTKYWHLTYQYFKNVHKILTFACNCLNCDIHDGPNLNLGNIASVLYILIKIIDSQPP